MERTATSVKQYSLLQILGIIIIGGAPVWILGWLVYPVVADGLSAVDAGMMRLRLMTYGLIWQFIVSMVILYLEAGNLRFRTISERFWLRHPVSPRTGETSKRLWWWLIPIGLVLVGVNMTLGGLLTNVWLRVFPFLAPPEGFDPSGLFAPEYLPQFEGAWNLFFAFLALGIFNTFLGEEFLFRGVLLPRMNGVFGRWDWVANGLLFTIYHIHQPWSWLAILPICLVFAWSGKRFKSNWFPIILHSAQTVIILVLILGAVLGLA